MFKNFLLNPYNHLISILVKSELDINDIDKVSNLLTQIDAKKLFEISKENEVASIIFINLRKHCNKLDLSEWEVEYDAINDQISWMIEMLEKLAKCLNDERIDIIALKNAGIAKGLLHDYGICPMGDIDTLVNKEDFELAHKIILELGFKFKFRSEYEFEDYKSAFADGSTEYYLIDPNSNKEMWLELAWRPIAGRWINQEREPKADELILQSKKLEDSCIRMLSAEDNLLQVCVHTAKHSYIRKPGFRLHLDVERIVKYEDLNWQEFLLKVDKLRSRTCVYYSLYCAKILFNCNIDDEFLQKIKPNFIKRIIIEKGIEKMNLEHPEKMKFTKFEFIIFQSLLYDNIFEFLKVAFPGKKKLEIKYDSHSLVVKQIMHMADLIGIRKKKS